MMKPLTQKFLIRENPYHPFHQCSISYLIPHTSYIKHSTLYSNLA